MLGFKSHLWVSLTLLATIGLGSHALAATFVWEMDADEGQVKNGPEADGSTNSVGFGTQRMELNTVSDELKYTVDWNDLGSDLTNIHIHGPADPNQSNPAHLWDVFSGVADVILAGVDRRNDSFSDTTTLSERIANTPLAGFTREEVIAFMQSELGYVNIHTADFPGGEIRAQLKLIESFFEQTKSQRKCTNGLNKNFEKVTTAQRKDILKCIKDFVNNKGVADLPIDSELRAMSAPRSSAR